MFVSAAGHVVPSGLRGCIQIVCSVQPGRVKCAIRECVAVGVYYVIECVHAGSDQCVRCDMKRGACNSARY